MIYTGSGSNRLSTLSTVSNSSGAEGELEVNAVSLLFSITVIMLPIVSRISTLKKIKIYIYIIMKIQHF